MSYIIEQIILLVLGFIIICKESMDMGVIIALLIGVCCASLSMVFSNKYVGMAISVFLLGIGLIEPAQLAFIAVAIYCLVYNESYFPAVISAIVALAVSVNQDIYNIFFAGLISVLAAYLAYRSRHFDELNRKLKIVRDDSEENQLQLKERNRRLIEHQDQEVYVATLKERNRIAREIHDNVGHMLTRSILQTGALMTIHKNDEIGVQLSAVRENLDEAMNNIRLSVHDLHDESISLKQSIEEILIPLKDKYIVKLEYDIQDDMSRDKKYAMIGIVREAVSNIIKYSKKSMVDIILREHPGMYQLVVWDYDRDDAMNSEYDSTVVSANGGIGLQNMYDRVAALDGNISITKGRGFRIFVTLPKNRT